MDYRDAFKQIFSIPEFPRVRANDPPTSFEAAESIKEAAPQHYQVILECLKFYGPLGKDGISAMTMLDPNQIARRLNTSPGFAQTKDQRNGLQKEQAN